MTTWHGVVKADVRLSAGELVNLEVDERTGLVEIKARGERLLDEPATFVPSPESLAVAGTYPCCRHCANPCIWALRHGQHDRPCPHCAAGCTCRMHQTEFVAVIDPDCPIHKAAPRELEYDHDDAPVAWRTRCQYVHADHDGPCEPRDREA